MHKIIPFVGTVSPINIYRCRLPIKRIVKKALEKKYI